MSNIISPITFNGQNHCGNRQNKKNLDAQTTVSENLKSIYTDLYNAILGRAKFKKQLNWAYKDITDKMADEIIRVNRASNLNFNLGEINGYDDDKKYIRIDTFKSYDENGKRLYFDRKTGELLQFENTAKSKGNVKGNRITTSIPTDYKVEKDFPFNKYILYGNLTRITDINGKFLGASEFSRSDIGGEFDIYEYDPDQRCFRTGLAEYDDNKGKHIEKHLVSLDGTITDYVYADDIRGNRYLYYKITDAKGQVLYQNSEKFKVIDDNHFMSTSNGTSYDIQFSNDKIVVVKLDNEGNKTENKVVYNIKDYSEEEYQRHQDIIESCTSAFWGVRNLRETYKKNNLIDNQTVDRNLLPTLRYLSGDEWFKLKNIGVENIRVGGYYDNAWAIGGAVELGKDCINHTSILEHELGHEKFREMQKDENFIRIYEEEKKLCYEYLPHIELEQMDYFLKDVDSNSKLEILAEINYLLHTPNSCDFLGARSLYIMKYFPKTIAYVACKDRHNSIYN